MSEAQESGDGPDFRQGIVVTGLADGAILRGHGSVTTQSAGKSFIAATPRNCDNTRLPSTSYVSWPGTASLH
jgi:hypothetical protein